MTWAKELAKYRALEEAGEMYPDCPRCHGSRYESAVPYDAIDDYRPVVESYPCPLCVIVGTIDIDRAIEWLEEKVEFAGE